MNGTLLAHIHRRMVRVDAALTRCLDLMAAVGGLILVAPLVCVISILVKAQDGGPVFYRATRIGKGGHPFRLYKFRTMVVHADRHGPLVTTRGDARITAVGRWLRRSKLDELPQLVNVLRGEMSMVGPRPEDPRYVALYTPEQRQVLKVRPGITSAASLRYRHEEQMLSGPAWERMYTSEVMPAKLAIDLDYLARRNVWSDLGLILRTIAALVT